MHQHDPILSADAVQNANAGHPGMPMGAAAVAYDLWTQFLKHYPRNRNGSTATACCISPGTTRLSRRSSISESGVANRRATDDALAQIERARLSAFDVVRDRSRCSPRWAREPLRRQQRRFRSVSRSGSLFLPKRRRVAAAARSGVSPR